MPSSNREFQVRRFRMLQSQLTAVHGYKKLNKPDSSKVIQFQSQGQSLIESQHYHVLAIFFGLFSFYRWALVVTCFSPVARDNID